MNNLSPLQYRIKVFIAGFKTKLPGGALINEASICYNQKLPKRVNVKWVRESDGFIVGHINVDGYEFTTQGQNAKDFIEMVNDSIYAVYEIPPQYISELGGYKRYFPKPHQLKELFDKSISKSDFGFYSNQKCPAS